MDIVSTSAAVPGFAVDVLGIIAFEEDLAAGPAAGFAALVPDLASLLHQSFADERFKANLGQTLILHAQERSAARRVVVVGAGPRSAFHSALARHPAAALARIGNAVGARSLLIAQIGGEGDSEQLRWIEAVSEGVILGAYRFDRYLAAEKRIAPTLESTFVQTTPSTLPHAAAAAVQRGQRVARATARARDLVNEPAAALTPTALAADITARATGTGLRVTVLSPADCAARGMGLFLAVGQGSNQEARFIHVAWCPRDAKQRVVLVGKGVTFDSGGLSLKTNEGMLGMKADMAGAAAVLSAISVAAEEDLPVEVHALAACTENMPSGGAYKLGDVLRSMSGKTVEITNTDAEGRLTLADALTYGLALAPHVVLDFATLTGACVVALGPHTAGVMTNDDPTAARWLAAARNAGEDMWPLPLPPRLVDQLKSDIADLRNTGDRWGGALTAGLFLKEFVGTTPWIHVDLAGPATTDKEWGCYGKGATGFGVASIIRYLRDVAAQQ